MAEVVKCEVEITEAELIAIGKAASKLRFAAIEYDFLTDVAKSEWRQVADILHGIQVKVIMKWPS